MKKILIILLLILTVFGCSTSASNNNSSTASRKAWEVCGRELVRFINKYEDCGIEIDETLLYYDSKECYLYGNYELTDNEMDKIDVCLNNINSITCEELPAYNQKIDTIEGCKQFSKEGWLTKREVCMNNVTSFCLNLYSVCRDETKSELCEPAYFTDNDPKTEDRVDVNAGKLAWYCESYSTEPATHEDLIKNCSATMTCEQFGEMSYDFENLDSYCKSLK